MFLSESSALGTCVFTVEYYPRKGWDHSRPPNPNSAHFTPRAHIQTRTLQRPSPHHYAEAHPLWVQPQDERLGHATGAHVHSRTHCRGQAQCKLSFKTSSLAMPQEDTHSSRSSEYDVPSMLIFETWQGLATTEWDEFMSFIHFLLKSHKDSIRIVFLRYKQASTRKSDIAQQ